MTKHKNKITPISWNKNILSSTLQANPETSFAIMPRTKNDAKYLFNRLIEFEIRTIDFS